MDSLSSSAYSLMLYGAAVEMHPNSTSSGGGGVTRREQLAGQHHHIIAGSLWLLGRKIATHACAHHKPPKAMLMLCSLSMFVDMYGALFML
eukprot:scaffold1124_cov74-Skeletonema_dohrnii-CCMP3373.AAC.1